LRQTLRGAELISAALMNDEKRADADLRGDVLQALMLDSLVPKTVHAKLDDGFVTLTGTANWQYEHGEAELVSSTSSARFDVFDEIELSSRFAASTRPVGSRLARLTKAPSLSRAMPGCPRSPDEPPASTLHGGFGSKARSPKRRGRHIPQAARAVWTPDFASAATAAPPVGAPSTTPTAACTPARFAQAIGNRADSLSLSMNESRADG
jgi:hypothetical protein